MPQPLTRLLHDEARHTDDLERLEVIVGGPAVFAKIQQVAAFVRHEALSLEPPLGPGMSPAESRAAEVIDRQLQRRGVRQLTVIGEALHARADAEVLKELATSGSPTRHSAAVPLRIQVYDRRIAFFALAADDTRRGAYVTTAPTLVQIACRLFDEMWERAQVLPGLDDRIGAGGESDEKRLRVLRLLADGYTDERIAHRMGVSTRTVVRVVAQLQHDLGAKSRFQLALAAQKAGLLDDAPAELDARRVPQLCSPRTSQG